MILGSTILELIPFHFNNDTNTLAGAIHELPLREIYMYRGLCEMVLCLRCTHKPFKVTA